MVAKKMYSMDNLIDFGMTRLFQLAEYVCSRCGFEEAKPVEPKAEKVESKGPTIRFSKEEKMVEGELFK